MQFQKLFDTSQRTFQPARKEQWAPGGTFSRTGSEALLFEPDEPVAAPEGVPEPAGVPFQDITRLQCRWPLWSDPATPLSSMLMCGEPVAGRSYCAHHTDVSRNGSGNQINWSEITRPKVSIMRHTPAHVTLARSAADDVPVALNPMPVLVEAATSKPAVSKVEEGVQVDPPQRRFYPTVAKIQVPVLHDTDFLAEGEGDRIAGILLSQTALLESGRGIIIRLRDGHTQVIANDELRQLRTVKHNWGAWSVVIRVQQDDDIGALRAAIGSGLLHAAMEVVNPNPTELHCYWRMRDLKRISYRWALQHGRTLLSGPSEDIVEWVCESTLEAMIG